MLLEYVLGAAITEYCARITIEPCFRRCHCLICDAGEVGSLGERAAQETVLVLIAAAFPR